MSDPHLSAPGSYTDSSYDAVTKQLIQIASSRRGSITSAHKSVGSILDILRSSSTPHYHDSEYLDEDFITEYTPLRVGNDVRHLRDPSSYSQLHVIESHNQDLISTYSNNTNTLNPVNSLASLKRMRSQSTLKHLKATGTLPEVHTSIFTELLILIKFSIPLVITFLLQYSLNVASVFSVGKIGKTELAAVSLSTMTANISGYCLIQGAATALDTLCPQAYGRGDLKLVGLQFMRCNVFLGLLFIPIGIIWIGLAPYVMNLIVENDAQLVSLACGYLRILIIGLPGFILFETLKKYLQAQNIFHASTYVILFAAPFNAFANYYLVWGKAFNMGFYGAPTAIVITNYLMAGMLLFYTWKVDGYQCWCGFNFDILQNWDRLLHLAYNGTISVVSEWFFFELITLSAARFGTLELASQSVLTTICTMMYQVPFAISIAASTRVANFIGSGSKESSITASKASIYLSLAMGAFNGSFLTIFKTPIIESFTNDPGVIALAGSIIPLGALYQVNDSLSAVTGGVLRGQGRQKLAACTSLVSYYIFALPFSLFMGFYLQLKLIGLWSGLVLAIFLISCIQTWGILYGSDWEGIIEESLNDVAVETGDDYSAEIRSVISTQLHSTS
ncbi:hypothetical protein WICPIJ_001999 [Wickerhamomyces pijperi]|uniref:MATE efflux family protein n=1 Tax=Wickerhamomyces pijperi TaxID=599730 RepID=A0A9P8QCH4_WICPI|nr:hypothetical protein WICPIJ_001999 [Wickerhamomyces pijperi]